MPKALIVFDSATGNTAKMADAIGEGLENAGLTVEIKKVKIATMEDLLAADAIVLGSPTYFGNMSGNMKAFIDKTEKLYPDKLKNKVGAAFVSAAAIGDGCETALISLIETLLIHRMIVVGLQENAKVIGRTAGSMGALSLECPDEECLTTCRGFGKRIGDVTKKLI
jgi:NAD(P)H dehydrogenase (quinone)